MLYDAKMRHWKEDLQHFLGSYCFVLFYFIRFWKIVYMFSLFFKANWITTSRGPVGYHIMEK